MSKRLLLFLFTVAIPVVAWAQTSPPASLDMWTTVRREDLVAARVDQANTASKQTESPAAAEGTSLVDQSSAADFVSTALNFAGLSTGDSDAEPKTVSVTAYAFLSAIRGFDPLDSHYYNLYRPWRRWSATIGYDAAAEEEAEGEANVGKTRLYAVKYTTNDRDPKKSAGFKDLAKRLANLTLQTTEARERIKAYVIRQPHFATAYLGDRGITVTPAELEKFSRLQFDTGGNLQRRLGVSDDENAAELLMVADFVNHYFSSEAGIQKFEAVLLTEDRAAIDAILEEGVPALVAFEAEARKIVEELQKKPQFAFTATYKQPEETEDDDDRVDTFEAGVVFDKALVGMTTFNANAAYSWSQATGPDDHSDSSFRVSAQLRWQLSAATSMRASYFDLAAEGKLKSGDDDVYKAQAKLVVPLAVGVSMPISVTYANREELVEEEDVRGLIGFTIDFAKALQAFRAR